MKKIDLNIKSVIFDMDGVITNTMPDHFKAWGKIFKDTGIHVTHYDVYKREGQRGITSVKEILADHNIPCTDKRAKELLAKKEELFKRIVKTRFIEGARNFIKCLHHQGLLLALVTGTSRDELHKILPEYLIKLFSVIITGSDVKNGKPNPEPYLLGLKQLNLKASEVIVIENAPFGIQSATAAGLTCVAIETSLTKKHLIGAKYIFSSIKEMRDKINFIAHNSEKRIK